MYHDTLQTKRTGKPSLFVLWSSSSLLQIVLLSFKTMELEIYFFFKFCRLWRGQLRLIHLASRTKFPRGTQDRLPYQRLGSLLRRRHFLVLQGMHQRILISLHNIHNYRKSRQISPALEFSVSFGNCVCFFLKCGYQLTYLIAIWATLERVSVLQFFFWFNSFTVVTDELRM